MRKKIVIFLIVPTIMICLSLLVIIIGNFYLNHIYPENFLKNKLKTYITDNYNRAVTFDKIYINYYGDIEVKNLSISNTDDFNDESILLYSEDLVIDLDLKLVLKKIIHINKIIIKNSEVNIVKHYDLSYKSSILKISKLMENNENIYDFIKCNIEFEKILFTYTEYQKNSFSKFKIVNGYLKIIKDENHLKYYYDAEIPPNKSGDNTKGEIHLEGINVSDDTFWGKAYSNVVVRNFDYSYLNDMIFSQNQITALISGLGSFDAKLYYYNDEFVLKGINETKKLGLTFKNDNYMTVSNLFFNSEYSINYNIVDDNIIFNKLKLSNNIINLKSHGIITPTYIHYNIKSNEINLKKLSGNFTPYNYSNYKGKLKFYLNNKYNFEKRSIIESESLININDFYLQAVNKNKFKNYFKNTNIEFIQNMNIASLNVSGQSDVSDFDLSLKTDIISFSPLKSSSVLTINSNKFEINKINDIKTFFVKNIAKYSEEDKTKSYKEIFFIQRPAGIFINNNDLLLKINIKEPVYKTASFTDLKTSIKCKNGKISTLFFSLNGYDGLYMFDFKANMHSEWAKINYSFDAVGLNLSDLLNDLELTGYSDGKFNYREKYDSVFFKLSHLLENGVYRKNIEINNTKMYNTKLQKDFALFIKNNYNEDITFVDDLESVNIVYDYRVRSEVPYLNTFSFTSDNLFFYLRAKPEDEKRKFYISLPKERKKIPSYFNYNDFIFFNIDNTREFNIIESLNIW